MKGAKELADKLRQVAEYDWRLGCAFREWADIAAHLDAKAAIDSAVPSDANEIEYRWGKSHGDISILLDIIRRQAGEMTREREAVALFEGAANGFKSERDEARAEVERLKAALQAHSPPPTRGG